MILRWAGREIFNSRRFCLLFVLNLSLGLLGFIALDAFKVSLDQMLKANSKEFLSADISLATNHDNFLNESSSATS